jgi:cysteine-rich repeat protein
MTNRWHMVGLLLLAKSGLGCGRTDLSLTAVDAADGKLARSSIADAAPAPDLAPSLGPDLAPALGPDLAPDLRKSICGSGVLDPGEECDDGNVEKGDGCSAVCQVETGFRCVVPGRRCTPICGDRRIVGMENCDDGNSASGDGCSEFCLTEDCWDCSSGACLPRPSVVDGGNCDGSPAAYCGNGRIEGAEECDQGAENSDDSYGGCSTHCHYLVCGDGIRSEPEECDLGSARNTAVYGDTAGCTSTCTVPHYCGDGYVDSLWGEMCDNGSLNGRTICTVICLIVIP